MFGKSYLSDTPDVLVPVLLTEAKILVQAEAHIVAIETVGSEAQVQQVLLERGCDGRLARRRQAGEPDGEARLLAECVALSAREGRVPGDVAVDVQYASYSNSGPRDGGLVGSGGALTLPL